MQRRTFFRLTAVSAITPLVPLVGCDSSDVTYGPFDAEIRPRSEGLVFFDGAGRSYAIDADAALISSLDAAGQDLGLLAGNVTLGTPAAVCATPDGTRFVVDRGAGRVLRLGDDGRVDLLIGRTGSAANEFLMPSDADGGADGLLYVADTLNHRITVLDLDGRVQRSLGTPGTGERELNAPRGVACARGRVYVANTGNGRVDVLGDEGDFLATFERPTPRFNPTGIARRGANEVLVISTNECALYVFDADGALRESRELRDATGRRAHPITVSVDPQTGGVLIGTLPGPLA